MQICYIFRDPNNKGNSIEEVFGNIGTHIEKNKMLKVKYFFYNNKKPLLYNIFKMRSINADIYHLTGDVNFLIFFLFDKRTVLTIHDIGHFKNLNGWKKIIYSYVWIKLPIFFSTVVTTVSRYSYEDIKYYFKSLSYPIKIINNPSPLIFYPQVNEFNKLKPKILQVGTSANKNIRRVAMALKGISCTLSIIGRLSIDDINFLTESGISWENLTNISYEKVYQEYVNCDIVIFVSTHEGFGMPILEAQAVGRPLITSNILPLTDIAGQGALIVNPYQIDEIKESILKIINISSLRKNLVNEGFRNVRRYNIEKITSQYIALYREILIE